FVADLIHDVDRIPAVVVDGLKERDGILDRVEGVDHFFPGQAQLLGDLPDTGLGRVFVDQSVAHLKRLVSDVPQRTTHPDGVVVPQIPANFADDHRHGVGGEAYV